ASLPTAAEARADAAPHTRWHPAAGLCGLGLLPRGHSERRADNAALDARLYPAGAGGLDAAATLHACLADGGCGARSALWLALGGLRSSARALVGAPV